MTLSVPSTLPSSRKWWANHRKRTSQNTLPTLYSCHYQSLLTIKFSIWNIPFTDAIYCFKYETIYLMGDYRSMYSPVFCLYELIIKFTWYGSCVPLEKEKEQKENPKRKEKKIVHIEFPSSVSLSTAIV